MFEHQGPEFAEPNAKRRNAASIFFPHVAGINWAAITQDASIPIVVTNRASVALQLCQRGQPAIAIMGASESEVAAVLRNLGAHVHCKKGAN